MSNIIPLSSLNSAYQISAGGSCDSISTSGLPLRKIRPLKIHCILPSSPWLADSKTNVPLGVLYIAGLLREQGHEIAVTSMLDKRYEGNIHLPEHVMDADVHMFGFCTPQFGEALELAAYIKDRNPDALLVAGGPHPSYEPKEVKEAGRQDTYHYKGVLSKRRDYRAFDGRQLFDTVIVMEGEVATLQMLSDWEAGKLQPYYYGDKADAMDLDAIPFPAWDLLPHDHIYNDGVAVMKHKYFESTVEKGKWPVMSMIGTRGCPYKCTYCFPAGTFITMADGSQQPIESLSIGDSLLAFDRVTGYTEARPVTRIGSRAAEDLYEVRLEDGTTLTVTGDHPFVTPEGWRRARSFDSGTYLRRMRRSDRNDRSAHAKKNMLGRVSDENSRTSSRRDVAGSTCKADGYVFSQTRSAGEAQRNAQTGLCRWAKSHSSETARKAIRVGAALFHKATQAGQTRYSSADCGVGTHENCQSNAATGDCCQGTRKSQRGIPRRTIATALQSSLKRCRIAVVRLLREGRFTTVALRRQKILDWTMSLRLAAQSRYAALVETPRDSIFVLLLAYAGGHGNTTSGLRRAGLGGVELLGRLPKNEVEREFGDCPGGRISGDWIRVDSVSFVGRGTVYPISVGGHETFFAEDFATHNCSTPWIGQKPRYRSPANQIAELKAIFDIGVRQVKWQDDTYTLHRSKLRQLGEAIHAEFGDNTFASRVHTRVNTMDDHVAESLKMMSAKVVCFGIESGSQKVLDANQKGTRTEQNTAALIKAKEHGFYTIGFLVAGMAGETVETAHETMDWLKSVRPYLDSCNLAVGIPYPGSRWWTHPQESGIDIVDYNYDNTWIVGFSARDEILVRPHGATVDEMFKIKEEMFQFLVAEGWAKNEWQEDARIKQQQQEAVEHGTLTAASTLSYAGH